MKKIIYPSSFVLAIVLAGCSFFNNAPEISQMTINYNDGPLAPGFYSEEVMVLVPDYEKRELRLSFEDIYPNRTEETPKEDFEAEGSLGGDYFERFEYIVEAYYDGDLAKLSDQIDADLAANPGCTGAPSFEIFVMDDSEGIDLSPCGEFENDLFTEIKLFYSDIVNLLEQEVLI